MAYSSKYHVRRAADHNCRKQHECPFPVGIRQYIEERDAWDAHRNELKPAAVSLDYFSTQRIIFSNQNSYFVSFGQCRHGDTRSR